MLILRIDRSFYMRKVLIALLVSACLWASGARASEYINQMGEVVEEIALLNLLRGIYLNGDQARKIAAMAQEAQKVRADALAEIEKLQSMAAFNQLRDELYTALAENPPAVRAEVVKLDNRAHEITGKVLHRIAGMEDEIRRLLTHGQQNIFWSFVPCIVPELDFENPVRTGQAAASSRLMPAAELIRTTPEEMWKKHGQAYLDHILKVIEQDAGRMTEATREDLRRRLVKHAWKIRKMKEADYMINRDKLAEELLLINREHTQRSGFRSTGKIARFFLSPAAARVLPRWVEVHFNAAADGAMATPSIALPSPAADASGSVPVPADPGSADKPGSADQSIVPDNLDPDREFWEKKVPKSLARLSETPYFNQIYDAFGRSMVQTVFAEEDHYVDTLTLLKEAGVILTREKDLQYYTLTPGEP